jgi:Ferritin-like domain
MNFNNIIKELGNIKPEILETPVERRRLLTSIGKKIALTAVPVALTSLFNKANAQTASTTTVIATLNYLLELEYFEYNLFRTANSTGGLIPTSDQPGLAAMELHEKGHINLLNTSVTALGGTPFTPKNYNNNPYCPSAYDFTSGGQFPIFTNGNYYLFLDLAQAFQDLFVRAYKNVIPTLTGNTTALNAAVQIHSVEGRHAAHVRYTRRFSNNAPDYPKPWITNNISFNYTPVNAFIPFYAGEDNTIQGGSVDITTLPGAVGTLSQTAATEAFDEPMDQAVVLHLISPFLV